MVVVNGCSVLDYGTLKSLTLLSQEWFDEMSCFACWYKFRKAKYVKLIIIGWVWSKNGQDLLDHGTLKSGVSHKRFVSH